MNNLGITSNNFSFDGSALCAIRADMSADYSQYSDEQLREVISLVGHWHEAFSKSPECASLSQEHQREAGAITEFFAHYSYTYLGLGPERWKPASIFECCAEILPKKVSAEPAFFEAVAPVLSAFFTFLGAQGLLRKGRALAVAAIDAHEEIVANAQERSNWGPAKHFAMAAQEAGVDIRDPHAVESFMAEFNLRRLAGPSTTASTFPLLAPYGDLSQREKVTPPANRSDPCPCGSGKKYKFCCASGA